MHCKNCQKGLSTMDQEALIAALSTPKPVGSSLSVATNTEARNMSLEITTETLEKIIETYKKGQVKCRFKLVYSQYKWRLNFVYKAPDMDKAEKIELGVF